LRASRQQPATLGRCGPPRAGGRKRSLAWFIAVRPSCVGDSNRPHLPKVNLDSGWCRPLSHLGAGLLKESGSGGEIVAGLVDALMFFAHSATSRPATSSPATPEPANAPHTATLVVYQGRQVPGYRVAYAPRGWVIQG